MPSTQFGWSSSPQSPLGLRIGAAGVVVAVHIAVVAAIMWAPAEPLEQLEPDAVMVSMIDAPMPEMAKAEPASAPQQTAQEAQPEPLPEKEPELEPGPEPEPVVEKAPEPASKPKPKPKLQSKPKAQQAPKQETEPKPESVDAPPSGNPEGADAPKGAAQGPVSNEPVMLSSNVAYLGGKPTYPAASRRMREEGRVVVLVDINTEGIVERARIDTTSGYTRLDEAALAAARTARFKPLTRNGVAYSARAKLPFDFVLRN